MTPDNLESQAERIEGSIARRLSEAERGRQAKDLLAHPLLAAAFADVEAALQRVWAESHPRDKDLRDDAWRSQRLLRMLQTCLRHHVETGRLTEIQLPLERSKLSRIRRALERVKLR